MQTPPSEPDPRSQAEMPPPSGPPATTVATANPPPVPPAPAKIRWLSTIVLAAVLGVVVFGGYVAADALSQPAGPPVTVAGVVRVQPLSGWELAGRFEGPSGARLSRGSGNLDFAAVSFNGSSLDLVREYVNQVLEPGANQLSVSKQAEPVTLRSGLAGVRIRYIGLFDVGRAQASIEGEVTAIVSPDGVGAIFDAWSSEGLLQYVIDDIHTMIDRAEID
jgi:hypothetical protein